jgi:hypothetical protein
MRVFLEEPLHLVYSCLRLMLAKIKAGLFPCLPWAAYFYVVKGGSFETDEGDVIPEWNPFLWRSMGQHAVQGLLAVFVKCCLAVSIDRPLARLDAVTAVPRGVHTLLTQNVKLLRKLVGTRLLGDPRVWPNETTVAIRDSAYLSTVALQVQQPVECLPPMAFAHGGQTTLYTSAFREYFVAFVMEHDELLGGDVMLVWKVVGRNTLHNTLHIYGKHTLPHEVTRTGSLLLHLGDDSFEPGMGVFTSGADGILRPVAIDMVSPQGPPHQWRRCQLYLVTAAQPGVLDLLRRPGRLQPAPDGAWGPPPPCDAGAR